VCRGVYKVKWVESPLGFITDGIVRQIHDRETLGF